MTHKQMMRERRAPMYGVLALPLLPVLVTIKFVKWAWRNA